MHNHQVRCRLGNEDDSNLIIMFPYVKTFGNRSCWNAADVFHA